MTAHKEKVLAHYEDYTGRGGEDNRARTIKIFSVLLVALFLSGCSSQVYNQFDMDDYHFTEALDFSHAEGEIDFSIEKSINENIPPFIFNVLGGYRMWQEPCCSEPSLESGIIDTIRITDLQGALIQEISGFFARPSRAIEENLFGLHFADYNFDGYLDIAMHIRHGGNRDAGDFFYWLWNSEKGQFVFHHQLSNMRGNGNISINAESQLITVWFSHSGGRHHTLHEYNNDIFVPVEIFFWDLYWSLAPELWNPPEGNFNVRLTQQDLVTGAEKVWYEYWNN